jgi:hypothetical protein
MHGGGESASMCRERRGDGLSGRRVGLLVHRRSRADSFAELWRGRGRTDGGDVLLLRWCRRSVHGRSDGNVFGHFETLVLHGGRVAQHNERDLCLQCGAPPRQRRDGVLLSREWVDDVQPGFHGPGLRRQLLWLFLLRNGFASPGQHPADVQHGRRGQRRDDSLLLSISASMRRSRSRGLLTSSR